MISFSIEIAILTILLLLVLLYKLLTLNYDYWEKRKVPFIKPIPPFGNFYEIATFQKTNATFLADLYNKMDYPYFGIFVFNIPHLILKSPELVKDILVKDFNYFTDRTAGNSDHDVLSSDMLFFSKNPKWKKIRAKMTPLFTSGKLKSMFPLINNVGNDMKEYLSRVLTKDSFEAKELCSKYSTDVIAKCAFAINAHSFDKENAEFRLIGSSIFEFSLLRVFTQTSFFYAPFLVKLLKLRFVPKHCGDFFRNVFWNSITQREANGIPGNDLIDIINDIRKDTEFVNEVNFVNDSVVSQAMQFFLAGFETTSSTMAFTLYELCLNLEIQRKVRNEIKSTFKDGVVTYDGLQDLKYLTMCISETLRMYPFLPFLDRRCNTDYKIPGTDTIIEKGTPIYIPMFGFHYDEKYFPNPKKFHPERFANPNDINDKGLYYFPFGGGPRNCIGARFGMISVKTGLVHILMEYEVQRSTDTPVPIVFETKSFILGSKDGLPMKFVHSPLF